MTADTVLATIPLFLAAILLIGLQVSSSLSGLATLVATLMTVCFFPKFQTSFPHLLLALGGGLAKSLTVFYVVLPSLLFYRLLQTSGAMKMLGQGLARLVPHRNLQVLFLVMGLAPFAESVSGFGVGTVLIIPIFIALGYSTAQSAVLGLLGQMAVSWGGLAIGTALAADLTQLDPNILGANTAVLMAPLPLIYGLIALFLSGGKKALRQHGLIAIGAGSLLSVSLGGFSLWPGIELAGILGSLGVMLFLLLWGQRETASNSCLLSNQQSPSLNRQTGLSFGQAIAPYGILTVLMLSSRLIFPLKIWLQHHFLISIPALTFELPLLYHPGFFLCLTALASTQILKISQTDFSQAMSRSWQQFIPGAIAMACFLGTSQIMQGSGMIKVLGQMAATLGENYQWTAPTLAAFGGWLTGSSLGSNALLSYLQQEVSLHSGLSLEWLMGAQNAASAHATIIAPARIILVTTAVGWVKGEGWLLRQLTPIVVAAVILTTLLLSLIVG
ncbi:MAG: L-lactate permease [Crocosphaera sp.]|nr:L-lactate permease [Crocosphaera sp.]